MQSVCIEHIYDVNVQVRCVWLGCISAEAIHHGVGMFEVDFVFIGFVFS